MEVTDPRLASVKEYLHPSFTGNPGAIDLIGLSEYFAFGETWDGRTLNEGLRRKWLHPDIFHYSPRQGISLKEWGSRLSSALQTSTAKCLDEEEGKRIGISLSGGLDSRCVLASVPEDMVRDVVCFTFGNERSSDVKAAKRVCQTLGVKKHIIVPISPTSIIHHAMEEMMLTKGQCYVGVAFSHEVAKVMRRHIDVLMDGFALDQMLGGGYLDEGKIRSVVMPRLPKYRLFNDEELSLLLKRMMPVQPIIQDVLRQVRREGDAPPDVHDQFSFNTHILWGQIGDLAMLEQVKVIHPTAHESFLQVMLQVPAELRFNHQAQREMLLNLNRDLASLVYANTGFPASWPIPLWRVGWYYRRRKYVLKRILGMSNPDLYVDFSGWIRHDPEFKDFVESWIRKPDAYLDQAMVERLYKEHIDLVKDRALQLLYIVSFRMYLESMRSG